MLRGLEGRLAAVTGDAQSALDAALEAGVVLEGHERGVPSPCRGAFEDPAEVLLDAWESAAAQRRVHDAPLTAAAEAAVARLEKFAGLYPVCRPSALVLHGRADRLRGQHGRAKARFEEAAQLARRMGLRGDEHRAQQEGARLWPPTAEARQS